MSEFEPDYRHVFDAASNRAAARLPLYEHLINTEKMEQMTGLNFAGLESGSLNDRKEFFRIYNAFYRDHGYDTVSYEACIVTVISDGEALSGHIPGPIQTRADFEAFPFDQIPERFWARHRDSFTAFSAGLLPGMKGVGGIGNGVFEVAQDLVGYEHLCILTAEDPELYRDIFRETGKLMLAIWTRFLAEFGEAYILPRFGDDLGFKSNTLLNPRDIRDLIIPEYRKIVDLVHDSGKRFLLHSCGNIFNVMDDIIEEAKIDAKHSNEDQIAPFSVWLDRYGDRIGNFGGVDMNVLCQCSEKEIREYTAEVIRSVVGHGGCAIGSGNSIPEYVPTEGYLAMVDTVREIRGDFRA